MSFATRSSGVFFVQKRFAIKTRFVLPRTKSRLYELKPIEISCLSIYVLVACSMGYSNSSKINYFTMLQTLSQLGVTPSYVQNQIKPGNEMQMNLEICI